MAGIGSFIMQPASEDIGIQLDRVLLADLDVAGDAP